MKASVRLVGVVVLALGACSCKDLLDDPCKDTDLQKPWSMEIYALGDMEPTGLAGVEAKLTFYKQHCSGTLGPSMEYRFASDMKGSLFWASGGVFGIDVKNSDEVLFFTWSIEGRPVKNGAFDLPYSSYRTCESTGSLHVYSRFRCNADYTDCDHYKWTTSCG